MDCDCGAQLTAALKLIAEEGGILVYAFEEGRGWVELSSGAPCEPEQAERLERWTRRVAARLGIPAEISVAADC